MPLAAVVAIDEHLHIISPQVRSRAVSAPAICHPLLNVVIAARSVSEPGLRPSSYLGGMSRQRD